MTVDALLAAGFREGSVSPSDDFDRIFWYASKDDYGLRWQVAVRFWRLSKYGREDRAVPDGWDFELHLREEEGEPLSAFRVVKSIHGESPVEILGWCSSMWDAVGAYAEVWE